MKKKFKLSKAEKMHFDSLTYTMNYLEQSASQFIGAVITERLGEKDPKKSVEWKLDGDDLILEITDIEEPADFFVSEPGKQ